MASLIDWCWWVYEHLTSRQPTPASVWRMASGEAPRNGRLLWMKNPHWLTVTNGLHFWYSFPAVVSICLLNHTAGMLEISTSPKNQGRADGGISFCLGWQTIPKLLAVILIKHVWCQKLEDDWPLINSSITHAWLSSTARDWMRYSTDSASSPFVSAMAWRILIGFGGLRTSTVDGCICKYFSSFLWYSLQDVVISSSCSIWSRSFA